jgi:hypothetical protein
MVKYLKTRKGQFYKLLKNGKKKRISQKKYRKKKTRKNIKMMGGGNIIEVNENDKETEFEQTDAVINYGLAPISTFNLVNCLAIGGVFELDGHIGTFLTHESPTDYIEHKRKLTQIKQILDDKNATITQIMFFPPNEPGAEVYSSGLTTTSIISLMIDHCRELFRLEPNIHYYTCVHTNNVLTTMCGKAIISPTQYTSTLIPIRGSKEKQSVDTKPKEMFIVDVEHDKDGDKIYKCPLCNSLTGTGAVQNPNDTSLFLHAFDCPNKNKIPVEKYEYYNIIKKL